MAYELMLELSSPATPTMIEQWLTYLDEELGAHNCEYLAKRKSGRLNHPSLRLLQAGAYEDYRSFCLERGQRESQFKTILLQQKKDCDYIFKTVEKNT
jgi:hypothetical protein